jgi:hypothetical protein
VDLPCLPFPGLWRPCVSIPASVTSKSCIGTILQSINAWIFFFYARVVDLRMPFPSSFLGPNRWLLYPFVMHIAHAVVAFLPPKCHLANLGWGLAVPGFQSVCCRQPFEFREHLIPSGGGCRLLCTAQMERAGPS